MIIKIDKLAAYLIIAFAAFQCWYASSVTLREGEAYFVLKSLTSSWAGDPSLGVMEYITQIAAKFNSTIFALRIPSIMMSSFAAVYIFKSAFLISGRNGAWAALLVFLFTPIVCMDYSILSSASAFLLFVSISYFYWLKSFKEGGRLNFIIAGLFSGLSIFADMLGVFVMASVLFYILLYRKELLSERAFFYSIIFFSYFPLALFLANMFGYPIIASSSVVSNSSVSVFLVGFLFAPSLIFASIIYIFLDRRKLESEIRFLYLSLFFGGCVYFMVFATRGIDIKLGAPLFIASAILCGTLFDFFKSKAPFCVFLIICVITSLYVNIAGRRGFDLPHELSPLGDVYKSFAEPIIRGLPAGGAVFADDKNTASNLAYYVPSQPLACTYEDCIKNFGLYITKDKNIPDSLRFDNVSLYGTYRIINFGKDEETFNIFRVQ